MLRKRFRHQGQCCHQGLTIIARLQLTLFDFYRKVSNFSTICAYLFGSFPDIFSIGFETFLFSFVEAISKHLALILIEQYFIELIVMII